MKCGKSCFGLSLAPGVVDHHTAAFCGELPGHLRCQPRRGTRDYEHAMGFWFGKGRSTRALRFPGFILRHPSPRSPSGNRRSLGEDVPGITAAIARLSAQLPHHPPRPVALAVASNLTLIRRPVSIFHCLTLWEPSQIWLKWHTCSDSGKLARK